MFDKKNKKINDNSEYLESVKFHTMKDDLSGEGEKAPNIENKKEELYENKGGSPFLNNKVVNDKAVEDNTENVPEKEMSNDLAKAEPKKENIALNNFSNPKTSGGYPHLADISESETATPVSINDNGTIEYADEKKSVFGYVVIFIIILLLGAGGYYFWILKEGDADIFNVNIAEKLNKISESVNINPDEDLNNAIDDLSDNKNGFSDKVNFMIVNDGELSQLGITKLIDDKFTEMEKYSGNQLEFLLVDKNNKPISFKNFADNFKITLGDDVLNNVDLDNFSVFLYRNGDIKRVDLVIGVNDVNSLKTVLARDEKKLVKDLDSLFVYEKPENYASKQFDQSDYNGSLVRYLNLNKELNLSLDYSIVGDYLVFATNKESGRLIIDKLLGESEGKSDIFNPEI